MVGNSVMRMPSTEATPANMVKLGWKYLLYRGGLPTQSTARLLDTHCVPVIDARYAAVLVLYLDVRQASIRGVIWSAL